MGICLKTLRAAMTIGTPCSSHQMLVYSLIFFSAVILSNCENRGQQALPEPYPTTSAQTRQLRTYDAFWDRIKEKYLYGDNTDFDWDLLRHQTRRKVEVGMTDSEFDSLMRSTVDAFPANTITYRTRSERIDEDLGNTLSYEGIGAYIAFEKEPEPHVVLLSVIAGSPAEEAGLRSHESIYSVDDLPVTIDEGMEVVERVRGPEGSVVTLDVQNPDGSRRRVNVTRGRVTASDTLRWEVLDMSNTGLILIPIAATGRLSAMIIDALQGLEKEGIDSLIIDMRIAHSTASWPLVEMLSLFIDGQIGAMHFRDGTQSLIVSGRDVLHSQQIPLAILVGADTQGASEVFAAGLQASDRAVVIGLPTPGKVLRFDWSILPNGSKLLYATSSYLTPDGRDLGLTGVQPDILVNEKWGEVDDNFDPVVSRAMLHLTQ